MNHFVSIHLTYDDEQLEDEPGYHERPPVAPDAEECQRVDGDAHRAEEQHHAQHGRGQAVALQSVPVASPRLVAGGHPVPDAGQEGREQVRQQQEEADQAHEGVQGAAALAHAERHHGGDRDGDRERERALFLFVRVHQKKEVCRRIVISAERNVGGGGKEEGKEDWLSLPSKGGIRRYNSSSF